MNKPIIIAYDVDDVLAEFSEEWLFQYNSIFMDNVKTTDVLDWNISGYCKKASKDQLYGLLDHPEFYEGVSVMAGALDAIKTLRTTKAADGSPLFRVIFVTACLTMAQADKKLEWLKSHGFFDPRTGYHYQGSEWEVNSQIMKDYFPAKDKSLVTANHLIDDNVTNCLTHPGWSVLFNRPSNSRCKTPPYLVRKDSHASVVEHLLNLHC